MNVMFPELAQWFLTGNNNRIGVMGPQGTCYDTYGLNHRAF